MTEAVDRADPKLPRAGEPILPKPPVVDRISNPDWIDWCDADR